MRLRKFLDEGRSPSRKVSDAKSKSHKKKKKRKKKKERHYFRGSSFSSVGDSSFEESDLHPLVEALARVDKLAGAPARDACLTEGEYASSPVGKALMGSDLSPFGCPEPFFLLTAPSSVKRRWMVGGWSGENSAVVRRWERFWNCRVLFWMLQVLLASTIRDSELSSNLARELLPVPGPLFPCSSRRTYPLLRVRGA